ncbi:MAG: hypothetical protein EA392_07890 [Cryomorphaceae bacterium]|nr:MAG: hypothetical protein EA392_07890 [Cryomorphaceae bacterium]
MDIYDVVITLVYISLIYALAFVTKSFHGKNELYQKYFIKGLTAKIVGGLSYALVYTYYYDYGGDSLAYFHDARLITRHFFSEPLEALSFIWNPAEAASSGIASQMGQFRFHIGGQEFPVVRVAAILNILGMDSFFSTTVFFASLSYVGVWHFFLVFAKRYPAIKGQMALSVLFIPSVFFWGSGIMKDTMVIGFLGIMMYGIDRFLRSSLTGWGWLFLVLYSGFVIFSIKAYVIMALAPALLVWMVMNYKDRIKNQLIRTLIVPFLLAMALVGVVASVQLLGQYQSKYSLENFLTSAQSIQNWHYIEGENTADNHGRGSSYTLGEYDSSVLGVMKVFPAAVNVTLFRPYPWEISSVMMIASAAESAALFIFSLFIFFGLGFFRVIRLLFKDPFLLMSVTFALFFAFAVGFTSYNFGALARYKIPCIPFYVASLLILNYEVKMLKAAKKNPLAGRKQGSPHAFSARSAVAG